ncbi:MAG: glycosyltransferase family 4 protein [Chloroflexota bacterium]|nr:glycosyltransferase family 4 protein [Chloroflexota bacterium]
MTDYAPSNHGSETGVNPLHVAMVSTSPPRQCGIATFTSDLARAMQTADPQARLWWAAIDEEHSIHPYGPQARWRIRQRHPGTYQRAAAEINESNVDIVSIQHEFGLYGIWGEAFEDHLAPFLETLRRPLVTTLHTTLPDPSPSVKEAVQRIGRHSKALIVMAHRGRTLLEDEYGIDPAKVHVIPHGVPPTEPHGRRRMKQRLGLQDRSIISTFGLISPRKGLEHMVRAMTDVVRTHPDALYLIVGKAHPELRRHQGEAYRIQLTALVHACGLDGHVAFVDEYLSQSDIVDYLLASDVYVTPYLDPNQITSGTLAYALGAGKAIVSTPYLYADEVLADGRGLLVDFRSERGLADGVLRILDDHELKHQLERAAYEYGRRMAWPRIGEQVMELFREVVSKERDAARQPSTSSPAGKLHVALGGTPSVPAAAIALAGNPDR